MTLVEVLVVLAVISVLAALLLSSLLSARQQSRKGECSSNLHQIALAVNMYMNDHDDLRPPRFQAVADQYVRDRSVLLCNLDATGNWGGAVAEVFRSAQNPPETIHYSYLLPLASIGFEDRVWDQLKASGGDVGIAVCQLHGQKRVPGPTTIADYSGLLLRARVDGSVVRRQVTWKRTGDRLVADMWFLFTDAEKPAD